MLTLFLSTTKNPLPQLQKILFIQKSKTIFKVTLGECNPYTASKQWKKTNEKQKIFVNKINALYYTYNLAS